MGEARSRRVSHSRVYGHPKRPVRPPPRVGRGCGDTELQRHLAVDDRGQLGRPRAPARAGPFGVRRALLPNPPASASSRATRSPISRGRRRSRRRTSRTGGTQDPEAKCYMPGVPRATYMPFPFQIIQGNSQILIAYPFASASRIIHMTDVGESPADAWMGWSRAAGKATRSSST